MSSRNACAACEGDDMSGIFRCEGCSQSFCLKHTNEHRHLLSNQLNEVIEAHEGIYHIYAEKRPHMSALVEHINLWESDSIMKIQQTAQNLRTQVSQLVDLQRQRTREKYNQISEQLQHARVNQQYLESDLNRWTILLEKLRYDLTGPLPNIVLCQQANDPLLKEIFLSKEDLHGLLSETLVSESDNIYFDDQRHVARHCGPQRAPAYVTGTQQYSSGLHRMRLFLSKATDDFILSFNIMSTAMTTDSKSSEQELLTYGWQSDDCVNPSHCYTPKEEPFCVDLQGQTEFHIELLIDCNNAKISYLNEKTNRRREIDVDVNKCPLPWKLRFYLYDVGDSVRLLSVGQLS